MLSLLTLLLCAPLAPQGAPPGYYDTVDASSAAALRATLHEVIDDHQRFPYTSGGTDTWDILEIAQQDPSSPSRILDLYRNASYAKQGGGNSFYNREHTWPNSYGFPNDGPTNYPYTDCHQLFLCDIGYNSARENKPYRACTGSCTEYTTQVNNGSGGGSGIYPGNSNWTSGSQSSGRWETWIGKRGDVARAMFYMDVRYEGGNHGGTGALEPDLILTDQISLIAGSSTGVNESVAYMGRLEDLLVWHLEDPVDDEERARNDVIFSFQGNRNPFVDHPEWVDCLFNGACAGPIEAYCFGVGCPCGNDDGSAGCANSSGGGALLLEALGGPGVGADDLILVALNVPQQQNGLLYMGGAALALPFGDGQRCVGAGGAGIFRFPVQNAGLQGALSQGPGLVAYSQGSFGAGGAIDAGETWYFQAWYRDPSGPCGSAYNLSNGLRVTFAP